MTDAIDIFINATDKTASATKSAAAGLMGVEQAANKSSGALGSFAETGNVLWSILGNAGKAAIAAATLAVAGLTFAFKDSIGEARESIATQKQLDAVLKSTGGAAGITAGQATDLATSLSKVTNYGDDTIISGENMLLTFTNIGSKVFPRATETMLDMSQALGQDLKSSSIQLGKALNDPIAGVSALSRVGVTFTDGQKDMIKTMVEAGDVAGAQGLILDELSKEFGGSAKAMADPAIMLQNQWLELEEQVGMFVIPILDKLSRVAMPLVAKAMDILADNTDYINSLLTRFYDYSAKLITQLWDWGNRAMPPLIESMEAFFTNITRVWDVVVAIVKPVADVISKFVSMKDVLTALGILMAGPLLIAAYGVVASLVSFLAPIAAVVAAVVALRFAWENDFLGIKTVTQNTFAAITKWFADTGIWKGSINETLYGAGGIQPSIIIWSNSTKNKIAEWVQWGKDKFAQWKGDIVQTFNIWKDKVIEIWGDFMDPIEKAVGLWLIGRKNDFSHFIGWFTGDIGGFAQMKTKAIEIWESMLGWWDEHVDPWIQYGKDIIQGLWDGMVGIWTKLSNWFTSTWDGLVHSFKEFFGISSPSRLMHGYGQDISQGLVDGIASYSSQFAESGRSIGTGVVTGLRSQVDAIAAEVKSAMQLANATLQGEIDTFTRQAAAAAQAKYLAIVNAPKDVDAILKSLGIDPATWHAPINNLPYSNQLPPPAAPVTPTNTIGTGIGGNLNTTGTAQGLLGGINLTTPDLAGAQTSADAAAKKVKDFIAGIGDFLGKTVSTSTLTKVFRDAFDSTVGAPGEGYGKLQTAQDKIRQQMASLLGLPTIYGTLDASANLDALTKTIGAGTDLNKVASLLQSAVDFRTLANYYDTTDQYGNVLPTDPRLTGQAKASTTNYNITIQGSNNANADVLGLVQMLGSLQGSATP